MEALKKSISETKAQMQAIILIERENHMRDQKRVMHFMMKVSLEGMEIHDQPWFSWKEHNGIVMKIMIPGKTPNDM